ncbi:MAG: DUF2911 domain-containing protein [Actinobacteria bacterium]|nr:DUF2911 domain-containing protein [Actinomycetota bacterium]
MLRRTLILGTALAMAGAALATAQQNPPLSPPGTANALVGAKWEKNEEGNLRAQGGKWLEVNYNRPSLRGRTNIFGSGADYGKAVSGDTRIWRAGANANTTFKTESPLMVGGKRVEPGIYAVLVELKQPAWTFILSSQPRTDKFDDPDKTKLFATSNYDPKFDVVRVPMTMLTPKASIDQFTIGFVDMSDAGGKLAMAWENTAALVPFTVAK